MDKLQMQSKDLTCEKFAKLAELFPHAITETITGYDEDNDSRGVWKPTDASAQAGHGTPSQFYELTSPSGRVFNPPNGRCWVYTSERMQEMIDDNRIWFGSDGNSSPAIKRFLSEVKQGVASQTIWKYEDVGHNQEVKVEFGDGYLTACFGKVTGEIITEIAKGKPYFSVFRDGGFENDSAFVNAEQIFQIYSPETERRVL